MVGGILFGLVSLKIGNRILTVVSLVLAGAGAAWLAFSLDSGSVALLVPVIMATGIGASIGGYYAVVPLMYPPQIRSSAFGWIIGFGRIVAIFTPIAAGYLLAAGWTGGGLFWAAAGLLVLSGVFCLVLVLMRKTEHTDAPLTEAQHPADLRPEPSQPTAG
jgi:MFS family permease